MKRPKLKKASKRMTCSKRYKIKKKIQEHKRKVRKEAKKSGSRKHKKDLGVPNAAPFKEAILREAQLRKQMREELKAAQKLERQKELAKKRNLEAKKSDKTENSQTQKKVKKEKPKQSKTCNELSERLFCREVNKVIETSDVILEVLDARDPIGTRCAEAEQAVLRLPNKTLLLVLNKIDLVPKVNVEKWISILNEDLPTVAFKCSTQVQERNLGANRRPKPGCIDVTKGTVCLGSSALLRILHELSSSKNDRINVGLIGFSNVGKSSLINSLKQIHVCNVSAIKGTTKILQEITIDNQIKLIDSPGFVVSPNNKAIAITLRSAFQRKDSDILETVHVILKNSDKQKLMLQYNISDFRNPLEFLTLLARKRGMLKKGGVVDTESAAKLLLNDWMGARMSYYSQPQTVQSEHITLEITDQLRKYINLEQLTWDNADTVKALKCPSCPSSIQFKSVSMTRGIMDENEIIEEEEPEAEVEEDEQDIEDVNVMDSEENVEEQCLDVFMEQKATRESDTVSKRTDMTLRSVTFDKDDDEADDSYDFNTDFI